MWYHAGILLLNIPWSNHSIHDTILDIELDMVSISEQHNVILIEIVNKE